MVGMINFYKSEEGFMSFVDTVQYGVMILDFEHNSPVMEVAELAGFHLCPVKPVMVSVLFRIDVL